MSKVFEKYSFITQNQELQDYVKKHRDVVWFPEEVPFENDRNDYDQLDSNTQTFIEFVLAFFAQADGMVLKNLEDFINQAGEIAPEAARFYRVQAMMEDVHHQVYNMMIKTLIRDSNKKYLLENAMDNFPCLKYIGEWIEYWMNPELSLLERMIAFACVEGILFTSAFCAIYWIKRQFGGKLEGVCKSNEWIARDETLHTKFSPLYYKVLVDKYGYSKVNEERVHEIVDSCVQLSRNFVNESLKVELIGMSSDEMNAYVECTADVLIKMFGYSPLYNTENPFLWMNNIGLMNKTNFFESNVSEYSKATFDNYTFELLY